MSKLGGDKEQVYSLHDLAQASKLAKEEANQHSTSVSADQVLPQKLLPKEKQPAAPELVSSVVNRSTRD